MGGLPPDPLGKKKKKTGPWHRKEAVSEGSPADPDDTL